MEPKLRTRIIRGLHALQVNPYEPRPNADIVRLRGVKGREDLFRLKIGDYRAIYAIEDHATYITDIFHRSYASGPGPILYGVSRGTVMDGMLLLQMASS